MKVPSLVRRAAPLVFLVSGALALSACSSSSTPPATTTTSSTATTTSTTTSTSTSAAQSTTTTTGTLVPQTPTETEFFSPSKNINCEIDFNQGSGPTATSTLCLTISPARSVVLKLDSTLTECTGQTCLSNAGTNTPTLQYGQSITLGPFTCSSSKAGIQCELGNGDGFVIASAGITPLGNAKVVTTTTTTG